MYDFDDFGVPRSPVPDLLWAEHHAGRLESERYLQPPNVSDELWELYVQAISECIRKHGHKRGDCTVKPLSNKQRGALDKVRFLLHFLRLFLYAA